MTTSSVGDDKPEIGPTLRGTKMTDEAAADVVAGLVGMVTMLASIVLRKAYRRALRKPEKRDVDAFAEPVGAILARRVDLTKIGPDLLDIIKAGAATGNYLEEGPLTSRLDPPVRQVGMEHAEEPPDDAPQWSVEPTEQQPVVTYQS